MQAVFLDDERNVTNFISSISKPRLVRYMNAAEGNEREALLMYHWNSQLSQALYLPLQSWEIALRNRLNDFLIWKYGANWPTNPKASRNLTRKDDIRLRDTVERQRAQRGGATATTNQIVADLSAGFWVSQLGGKYEIPYGWRNNLKFRIFVNDSGLDRATAADICDDLLSLRNRIAHHEPIFHLPLDVHRAGLDRVLQALCASTAAYMTSACSFAAIWARRPAVGSTGKGQIALGQALSPEITGR